MITYQAELLNPRLALEGGGETERQRESERENKRRVALGALGSWRKATGYSRSLIAP